jgi:pilus assembly protein Flp/PilA
MKKFLNQFIRSESGASAVEYGILVGVIALVAILGATTLGSTLNTSFSDAATSISSL